MIKEQRKYCYGDYRYDFTDGTYEVIPAEAFEDVEWSEVSAGVSSTLAEQMENYTKQGTDLASGVTDVMSDYLSVTAADMVSVSESDRDMTASGQEDETQTEEEKQAQALAEAASAFGYTNLGIAQADLLMKQISCKVTMETVAGG